MFLINVDKYFFNFKGNQGNQGSLMNPPLKGKSQRETVGFF